MSLKGETIIGGGSKAQRQASDFYPTPKEVTYALLDLVHPLMPRGGNLGASLRSRGHGRGYP